MKFICNVPAALIIFTTVGSDNMVQIFTHDGYWRNPNYGDGAALEHFSKTVSIFFDRSSTGFSWTRGGYNENVGIKPSNQYMTITGGGTSDYNTVINDTYNNSEYNNTYNYTTDNGDTITTYYGDNFINYSYDGTPISYDDFYDITNHIITDLTTNLGDDWNGDETPVHFLHMMRLNMLIWVIFIFHLYINMINYLLLRR